MVRPTDLARLQHAVALHRSGDIEAQLNSTLASCETVRGIIVRCAFSASSGSRREILTRRSSLLSKSIKYNSTSADAHYFLGRVLWQKKLSERAKFCLSQCVRIDPNTRTRSSASVASRPKLETEKKRSNFSTRLWLSTRATSIAGSIARWRCLASGASTRPWIVWIRQLPSTRVRGSRLLSRRGFASARTLRRRPRLVR